MRKSDQKQKINQFFRNLKQLMKTKGRELKFNDLLSTHRDEAILSKLTQFLSERIRCFNITENQIQEEFKKLLQTKQQYSKKFQLEKNSIVYISQFKEITNLQSFIKQIQKYPSGLLVDDELLKLSNENMKQIIRNAIEYRKVLSVKSKQKQKQNQKEKYYGYLLFPLPQQVKEYSESLYKIKEEEIEKEIEADKKLKRRLDVKTSQFRGLFEKIYKENQNKILKQSKTVTQNSNRKINSQWEAINRIAIDGYDQIIEEYIAKRLKFD